ncbi:MAG: beta-galactosidase [Candidatus Yanofskybacteria bacterium]|nr:beta-galactosidase [Candidatus Yanofskybacteria bacterium]
MKRILKILGITFGIILLLVGGIAVFLFIGEVEQAESITWGVTFGHSQAEELGLDWQETYLALLDDLKVRHFRIPVYWDELEPRKGVFDFSAWDWQLEELEKRGGKAFLAIGMKLPRWPECRMPDWVSALPKEERQEEQLRMMAAVVEHYKEHEAVWAWQIENEPFLSFGLCPERKISEEFVDREIAQVRELDPTRPIVLTDTGENSFWIKTPGKTDIFSSTLFRIIHDPTLGYVRYPYPPVMYQRKAMWLQWWHPEVRVIVGELQAEPWVEWQPITAHSLEAQYQTMSPEQFQDNIAYARATGLDEFYFWGAEWWYWTKEKADDAKIWNSARVLFQD